MQQITQIMELNCFQFYQRCNHKS